MKAMTFNFNRTKKEIGVITLLLFGCCLLTVVADQVILELKESDDLSTWSSVQITPEMISEDGKIQMGEAAQTGFYQLQIETIPDVPSGMALVEGGTLSMSMGTRIVDTFFIGLYEVTWAEWQSVRTWAAANGYDIGGIGAGCSDEHPVHTVSWYDILKWCNAKSQMEGLTPVYTYSGATYKTGEPDQTLILQNLEANGCRLPQEAEWEFAARGGNQTNGFSYSGSNDLNAVGWYRDNSGGAACNLLSGRGTWAVGQKVANELGLYDMSGNVWEWCWDDYSASRRLCRGGSWDNYDYTCTVSNDLPRTPDYRGIYFGFRLARSLGN